MKLPCIIESERGETMKKMPVLFVGHGSPMNAIENNRFTAEWEKLKDRIPRPQAILSISAHWFRPGLRVSNDPAPRTIYDMYGFPEELYQVAYAAPGAPQLAQLAKDLIGNGVRIDNSWGLDHGTWSVLCRIYPQADIPVFQLSVDSDAPAKSLYETGQKLHSLRERGVLIFGSGNVVHNLARVNWSMTEEGYPWAEEFDGYIKESILNRNDEKIINYKQAGDAALLSVPALDHYAPLLYVLGAAEREDNISVFNDSCALGALSMTGYLFEQ